MVADQNHFDEEQDLDLDLYQREKLDPDSHQSETEDPDLDPHPSEKEIQIRPNVTRIRNTGIQNAMGCRQLVSSFYYQYM